MGRSDQLLHFIYLQRNRLTCSWGRYDQNTENFSRFTLKSTFTVLQLHLQLHFHFRLVSDFRGHFEEHNRNLLHSCLQL
jgi:hypothetical protein